MFRDCDGLTSITIPNSVISNGTFAFEDCTGLTSVTFTGTSVPLFGLDVFYKFNTNIIIYVPVGCGDAYKAVITPNKVAAKVVEQS